MNQFSAQKSHEFNQNWAENKHYCCCPWSVKGGSSRMVAK